MAIYKSRDLEVPYDLNLTELLHTDATALPESHLIAKDSLSNRSLTIGALRSRAGRIAKALQVEFSPPDQARWSMILPNSVDYLEVCHAILWTGGIACPVNHALKDTEMGHGIAVSRPHFVIAYGKTVPVVNRAIEIAAAELGEKGVVWKYPVVLSVVCKSPGLKHIPDDFFAPTTLDIPHYDDTSRRLATIQLSSGTTGKPKGVELTHRNFVANVLQLFHHDANHKIFHPASRTVAYTPWTHIANTTLPLFLGPHCGMLHHAMPQYEPEEFAQLCASNQASSFQGVPSVVLNLANSDVTERHDFSGARVITVGGAPLKPAQLERLLSRAPWRFVQAYGMTEAAGYVAYQDYDETVPDGFTGRLLPGIEARLVKEGTRQDIPTGEAGELWLRAPNMSRGYFLNHEANEKAFPEPSWYNTGDVCRFNQEGQLAIVGRTKDLIKYKGFQVSPAELETYLNSHPLVAEAGIGSLWDDSQLTEVPTAYVILKEPWKLKTENEVRRALHDIHASVDGQVSGYKKLRGGVWLIDKLPKNATGKILRKELASLASDLCSLDKPITPKL